MTLKNSIFARKKSMENLALQDTALLVHIEHSKPIEINDLTKTLNAIGGLYSRFALENGANQEIANAKLYVQKIQEGSIDIVFTLQDVALALPIIAGVNTIVEFYKHIKGLFNKIKNKDKDLPRLTKKDCQDIHDVFSISAKDNKGIIAFDIGNKKQINFKNSTFNNCTFNYTNSNLLQNQTRELEQEIIEQNTNTTFSKVLMKLYQLQNTEKETKGNKAIISNISNKKLPVYFATNELKQNILFAGENPINKLFVVDVELQTIENIPKAYKITALYETLDDEEQA